MLNEKVGYMTPEMNERLSHAGAQQQLHAYEQGKGDPGSITGRGREGSAAKLLVLVVAMIALPGLLIDLQARPIPPNTPPAMDAFFSAVRAATPPTARILIAGTPPGLVFYRATYDLYPRQALTAFPIDYAHSAVAPPTSWRTLRAMAHRDGAAYVVTWQLPLAPRGSVRVRTRLGNLVEVTP